MGSVPPSPPTFARKNVSALRPWYRPLERTQRRNELPRITSQLKAHGHKSFVNELMGVHRHTAYRLFDCRANSVQPFPDCCLSPDLGKKLIDRSNECCTAEPPSLLQASEVTANLLALREYTRHAHTRASPLWPGCAHCRSLQPQGIPCFSFGPRVLLCFVARYAPQFPLAGCSRPSQRRHSRSSCHAYVPGCPR